MSVLTTLSTEAYSEAAFSQFTAGPAFNLENAKAMIWLSQLAYETDDPVKVDTVLARWGLSLLEEGLIATPVASPLPTARSQAVLARHPGCAVLAFAGTDPLVASDWVSDFNIIPHQTTTKGFALAVATALPIIRRRLAGSSDPVIVTGHSLGGALAVLAALDLAKAGVPVAAVYTYGMPRPGTAEFRAEYDAALGAATYRLVLGEDIVPTVAPSFLGFRHVGRLLRQDHGRRFRAEDLLSEPGSDEPPFGGQTVASLIQRLGATAPPAFAARDIEGDPPWNGRPDIARLLIATLPRMITDHLPDSYIAALTPS